MILHFSGVPKQIDNACDHNQPKIISNEAAGNIMTPSYPSNYPDNSNCTWLIEADVGKRISIIFQHFEIEYG